MVIGRRKLPNLDIGVISGIGRPGTSERVSLGIAPLAQVHLGRVSQDLLGDGTNTNVVSIVDVEVIQTYGQHRGCREAEVGTLRELLRRHGRRLYLGSVEAVEHIAFDRHNGKWVESREIGLIFREQVEDVSADLLLCPAVLVHVVLKRNLLVPLNTRGWGLMLVVAAKGVAELVQHNTANLPVFRSAAVTNGDADVGFARVHPVELDVSIALPLVGTSADAALDGWRAVEKADA
ncbi:hypothetical protein HG531_005727 [Fusarium graminearum]|nr:hypothetical protein HG531_005727 [Fusarium graminearum]